MKKGIIIIGVIVLLLIGWAIFGGSDGNTPEETASNDVSLEGVITAVDASQAPVDGPVLITIDAENGEEVIAVPTMGINLCAASESIADAFALEVGQFVDVRGERDSEGQIVPCESTSHYLRVSTE